MKWYPVLAALMLSACGGGMEPLDQKTVVVQVKDPNAPATTSSDIVNGQHVPTLACPTYCGPVTCYYGCSVVSNPAPSQGTKP